MTIIPQSERTVLRIYACPVCGKTYREGETNQSCLVLHSAGSCCHYGDVLLTEKGVEAVLEAAKYASDIWRQE